MVEYLSGERIQGLNNVFTAWDITDSAYADKSFSVSSYFAELGGIAFKTDGTKMYVSDYAADTVSEFTLSTAWDITTSTYVAQHSFTSTDNALTGVFFKSDGTKIFVVGLQNDTVYEFPLSSAWDITSVGTLTDSHSISTQETNPYQLFFKPDGLTMYVIGASNVNQYTLGSAWDLSGTVTHYKTFSVSSQDTAMIGLQFSSDGTKMFTAGYTNDKLYQYTLGTAWDLNGTVTYDSAATFTPTESETHPCGIFFNSNGGEFFILGTGQDTVYQYHTKLAPEKSSITNVPANTRFEETDTRKIYRKVDPTTITYESDFANNSTGWSTSNSRGGFDSTGAWSYNETSTPSNSAIVHYDLGAGNVGTEFVLRWRMKTASGTKPSNYTYFYLVEQDSLTPTNGTGFVWQGSANRINIGTQSAEPSTTFSITADTWYYFELVRTSLSTNGIKLYQYTDSNYTSPTLLLTSSGSTTGDERYIQLKSTHNGSVTTKVYVDGIKFYNGVTSIDTDEWKERGVAS